MQNAECVQDPEKLYDIHSVDEMEYDHEYDRFLVMKRKDAVNEIIKLQAKLWLIEDAVNTPFPARVTLPKNWTSKSGGDLAHVGALILTTYVKRRFELKLMEREFGKADDVRKQIVALCNEYASINPDGPAPWLPRGFTRMNPLELQRPLEWVKELIADVHKREAARLAEDEALKAHAERVAAHQKREAEFQAVCNALRNKRMAEVDGVVVPYMDAINKLSKHAVFRLAPLPKVDLLRSLEFGWKLGTMDDTAYQAALDQLRAKVAAATRGLREPLRRAWQSAYSRKLVKVDFKEYLKQEGFADLLT